MSRRTDDYLTICLEQAAKSPLHYRHSYVVVRGGKFIGKGYNYYRPRFSDKTFKTGATATSKQKMQLHLHMEFELKHSMKDPNSRESPQISNAGAGRMANVPLSMHSEMMAIRSALSRLGTVSSRGSARSTQWLQKSQCKMPVCGKRQLRLPGLKAYANFVFDETVAERRTARGGAKRTVETSAQESSFEKRASRCCQGGGEARAGASEEQYRETPSQESVPASSQPWPESSNPQQEEDSTSTATTT